MELQRGQDWEMELGNDAILKRASLVAQMIKNLPAMQETLVWSLSQENPLEKGMATHSSILSGESYEYKSLIYGI